MATNCKVSHNGCCPRYQYNGQEWDDPVISRPPLPPLTSCSQTRLVFIRPPHIYYSLVFPRPPGNQCCVIIIIA